MFGAIVSVYEEAKSEGAPCTSGAAVAIAGTLDDSGRLLPADNLRPIVGLDLSRRLEGILGQSVVVVNDAAGFVVGERWLGAGRDVNNLVGITLGTGLGIGMVIEDRLYVGSHGNAGQIWNTPMDGTLGFLMDDRCAGTIERSYRGNAGRALSSVEIADLAEQGDEAAGNAFRAFGKVVGLAVAFIVNIVDPEVVVFGGSIARSFEHFIGPMSEVVDEVTQVGDVVRLERSTLGDSSVLLGAARMFWARRDRP